ncbi:MAG: TetR/AcrR family transcriptional regulator [Thermoflexales bacterium]|nr:TetR/AcrR family transcriptional regulator [Thermoflexales bacterium]
MEWSQIHTHILELEQQGLVTRTFRRLDPERQQAVLDAILGEAVEQGPASLSVKRVARRAGVSVGSLYQYFANREGLLAFAVELCVRWMTDEFERYRPMLAAMPLREALVAYLVGGVEWSQTQVGLIQFFGRAAYQGDAELAERMVYPIATTLRTIVDEMLAQAAARGEIKAGVDLEATARVIHALTIAIGDSQLLPHLNSYFQVSGEEMTFERVLEALVALVMHGIGTDEICGLG